MKNVEQVEIRRPELNERVRNVRNSLGLTQEKFSKAIDISISYLAGIETKKRNVNQRIIRLIVNAFNVDEDWFETGEGEMFNEGTDAILSKFTGAVKSLSPQGRTFGWEMLSALLEYERSSKS